MSKSFVMNTMVPLAALAAIWVAWSASAAAQDAASIKRGQEVYAAQKCMTCHAIAGAGNKTNPLDGVGVKLSAAEIREWIVNPVEMTKKTKSTRKPLMQARYAGLPAADIDALVAYMQSLKQ